MAYLADDTGKKKEGGLNVLGQPGSFANIKAQLQQQQLNQDIQPVNPALQQQPEDPKKQKFFNGGIAEEEDQDEVSLQAGQASTVGGGTTGRGIGQQAPQQQSGSFTGIQDYLSANKPKIQQLASEVSSGISDEAKDLRDESALSTEKHLGEKGTYAGANEFVDNQISQAGTSDQAQADKKRFDSLYGGTAGSSNTMRQENQAGRLQDRAARLGTDAGRAAELQRTVGKEAPGYSSGQKRLDQLMLGGNQASRKQMMQDTREATQGLSGDIRTASSNINAERDAVRQRTGENVGTALKNAEIERQETNERLRGIGIGSDASAADLRLLGISAQQAKNLYGVDPTKHVRESGGITPEQLARMDALSRMKGDLGSQYDEDNFYQGGQGLLADIEGQKKLYDRDLAAGEDAAKIKGEREAHKLGSGSKWTTNWYGKSTKKKTWDQARYARERAARQKKYIAENLAAQNKKYQYGEGLKQFVPEGEGALPQGTVRSGGTVGPRG